MPREPEGGVRTASEADYAHHLREGRGDDAEEKEENAEADVCAGGGERLDRVGF